MSAPILDRPVWSALTTRQTHVALGGNLARRFAPDIGPLASARDDSPQSLAALAELIPPGGTIILLQADPIVPPEGVETVSLALGVQMVADKIAPSQAGVSHRIERLGSSDASAMLELATLTKPGPFESGTWKLGEFWGIKERGVLLAMAGERMKNPGYTEVSGVCTHPEAQGHGFASALTAAVATRILGRGEIPYLHTYATNVSAIRLYEKLGFRSRCPMNVAVLARSGYGRNERAYLFTSTPGYSSK